MLRGVVVCAALISAGYGDYTCEGGGDESNKCSSPSSLSYDGDGTVLLQSDIRMQKPLLSDLASSGAAADKHDRESDGALSLISATTKVESPVSKNLLVAISIVLVALAVYMTIPQAPLNPTTGLSGLRGLMPFMVAGQHVGVFPLGGIGMFFVLSGLGLAQGNSDLTSISKIARFQTRRLLRIFPAYWAVLPARAYFQTGGILALFSSPSTFAMNFLALQSWQTEYHNYLWFVSTIVSVYFMMPLAEHALSKSGWRTSIGAAVAVMLSSYVMMCLAVVYVMNTEDAMPSVPQNYVRWVGWFKVAFYSNPVVRLPQFLIGMCCAFVLKLMASRRESTSGSEGAGDAEKKNRSEGGSRSQRFFAVAHDILWIGYLAIVWYAKSVDLLHLPALDLRKLGDRMDLQTPYVTLTWCTMIASGTTTFSFFKWILTSGPMLVFGDWCYGIYLWHPVIASQSSCFVANNSAARCDAQDVVMVFTLSLLCGCASFHLVEEPARKFARWLTIEEPGENAACEKKLDDSSTGPLKSPRAAGA